MQLSRNCIAVESATDAYTATKTRIISTDIENEKTLRMRSKMMERKMMRINFNDNIIDCNF